MNVTSTLKLKFSNKFLPSTLPKTGIIMDKQMKIEEQSSSSRDKIPSELRKIVKG